MTSVEVNNPTHTLRICEVSSSSTNRAFTFEALVRQCDPHFKFHRVRLPIIPRQRNRVIKWLQRLTFQERLEFIFMTRLALPTFDQFQLDGLKPNSGRREIPHTKFPRIPTEAQPDIDSLLKSEEFLGRPGVTECAPHQSTCQDDDRDAGEGLDPRRIISCQIDDDNSNHGDGDYPRYKPFDLSQSHHISRVYHHIPAEVRA